MIEIIGAPFDLCGKRIGSRLGPAALRLCGLRQALRDLGFSVQDFGDACQSPDDELTTDVFPLLLEALRSVRASVCKAYAQDALPVVVGGEHTLSVGSVGAALQEYGDDLGVLWIDAHADINTPLTSVTGNLHGMPLSALRKSPSGVTGPADQQWTQLLDLLSGTRALDPRKVVWYGLRDVDPSERPRLAGLPLTMHHIDRHGVEATVAKAVGYLRGRGVQRLWISFDVDVLDPVLAPGTGTAVRGGLGYREAHLLAELLCEHLGQGDRLKLAGIDIMEVNPLHDVMSETARMAVEWLASLLGKSIL